MLGLTVFGFSTAYSIAIATDLPIFDRYALPAIPLVGLLLLRSMAHGPVVIEPRPPRSALPRRSAPTLAVLALGIVGLVFSTDSASFDATRWRVASLATTRGYRPLEINGGFEWIAYHRRQGPHLGGSPAESTRLHQIYLRGLCIDIVVNPNPKTAARAIARRDMRGLGHRPIPIVAVPNERSCRG